MHTYHPSFIALFSTNMGYRTGERILVFSDLIRSNESISEDDRDRRTRLHATAQELANFAGQQYGNASFVDFPATPASGAEPPLALWSAVFGDTIIEQLETTGLMGPLLEKSIDPIGLERARSIVTAAKDAVADIIIHLTQIHNYKHFNIQHFHLINHSINNLTTLIQAPLS